jgi:hypothetical protein
MFSTVRYDFSRHIRINIFFDLLQPFIFFTHKILFTKIDQIDH